LLLLQALRELLFDLVEQGGVVRRLCSSRIT
jgi:hypothetical protein